MKWYDFNLEENKLAFKTCLTEFEHDYYGDSTAIDYLESQGWTLTRNWTWHPPSTDYTGTPKDDAAITYLLHDWDFDGVESDPTVMSMKDLFKKYF